MFNNQNNFQLYKGDCLEIMKEIPDKSIDMILCDLPYGTTACKWDVIIPFDGLWKQYNRIIKDNGAIVLFGSEPFSSKLRTSNIKNYRYDWIWNKVSISSPLLAKVQPLKCHEMISVFYKKKPVYNPQMTKGTQWRRGGKSFCKSDLFGDSTLITNKGSDVNCLKYPKSIITFSNANKTNRVHPTQKPVPLLEYLIKTYTNEGEIVLDNCMGSGSTGEASLRTNRRFIGIEKDDKYFDIAYNRINGYIYE